jgi:hypothetical protein
MAQHDNQCITRSTCPENEKRASVFTSLWSVRNIKAVFYKILIFGSCAWQSTSSPLRTCQQRRDSILLVYSRRYPKYSRLTLPWIPLRLQALFTLFSVLGVGPDPRAASPSAWRWSICYPQHSAGGRRRYYHVVRPLEKARNRPAHRG